VYIRRLQARKTSWPLGPWNDEPDRIDFKHVGLDCFIQRHSLGAWCGYVGIPPSHPAYGRSCADLNYSIEIHGGLNHASKCGGITACLIGVNEIWWFGFDCAHFGDFVPGMAVTREKLAARLPTCLLDDAQGIYRDLKYVYKETEWLAEQLRTLEA